MKENLLKWISRNKFWIAVGLFLVLLGCCFALEPCDYNNRLDTEKIAKELKCSAESKNQALKIFGSEISECSIVLLQELCHPGEPQGNSEEAVNKLRLELNNVTTVEK